MSVFKEKIREVLIFFHLDITKNLHYDRLTRRILKRVLAVDSNCMDIGCHKGEVLDEMLHFSPKGRHYAFEPIPIMFEALKRRFGNNPAVKVFPYALAQHSGETTFHFVKNAPAYSGLKIRKYDISNPEIVEISVNLETIDRIFPVEENLHFIKIDVEGAEYDVLRGGEGLLKRCKPTILFECGKGAIDYYGSDPLDLFSFLTNDIGLQVFTLKSFINNLPSMSTDQFLEFFRTTEEYYFVASAEALKRS